jgi:hypothetical protein
MCFSVLPLTLVLFAIFVPLLTEAVFHAVRPLALVDVSFLVLLRLFHLRYLVLDLLPNLIADLISDFLHKVRLHSRRHLANRPILNLGDDRCELFHLALFAANLGFVNFCLDPGDLLIDAVVGSGGVIGEHPFKIFGTLLEREPLCGLLLPVIVLEHFGHLNQLFVDPRKPVAHDALHLLELGEGFVQVSRCIVHLEEGRNRRLHISSINHLFN